MRKKVRLIFLLFLTIAIIKAGISFRIREIVCISNERECVSEITLGIDHLSGKSVITSLFEIRNILENVPLVKDYSVNITPKGNLNIIVSEKESKYCLSNKDMAYHVDDGGIVIKIDGEKDSCVYKEGIGYNTKDVFSEEEMFPLRLHYLLRNMQQRNNMRIENEIFVIEYKGRIKLLFPLEGDARIIAGRVYYTLSQFDRINEELSGKQIIEADFRFKEPVIRYI